MVSTLSISSVSGANSNIGSFLSIGDVKVSKNNLEKLKLNKDNELSISSIVSKTNKLKTFNSVIENSNDINTLRKNSQLSNSESNINNAETLSRNRTEDSLNKISRNNSVHSNSLHNISVEDHLHQKNGNKIYNGIINSIFQLNENTKPKKGAAKRKDSFKRNIRNVHKIFTEAIVIYPFFVIFTLFISILYKYLENKDTESDIIIQSDNGEWYYKCNLETFDIIYSSLELFILIIIMIKGRTVLLYEGVFKCTKYIVYSSSVGIVFGPLANMISYSFLNNQKYERVAFDTSLNLLGYFVLFLCCSWDKIYYVMKNTGNDPRVYFKLKKYKKCFKHNTYTCGCKLDQDEENPVPAMKKYIIFYKFCSEIFEVTNGKIKYISMNSKTNVVNEQNNNNNNNIDIKNNK
ncbi:hypothetical protein PIROE2DRAFT_63457 [Piromyces sp. E2]|nr:hypothetical protein PIROE2DRAFT_63457 [Piromyces sp. E2]|eukprot:OUM59930.1 hypothetical protein PIROE2DRAFT_63457 [Piromyces sp. E2]